MTPALREYLLALTNTDDVETLWDMHCKRMAIYGFDRLLYGFTRYRRDNHLGDPNDFVVFTNHEEPYRKGFVEEGLYRHAPMVQWALNNDGWCSWRDRHEGLNGPKSTAKLEEVMAFNARHDVTAGYTISFQSVSRRSKGAISMAARAGLSQDATDRVWEKHGKEILLQNNLVHLKILTLPVSLPNRHLTPRQREALEWVGDGKTMQDIAQIMGLTQATIEKHLRLARESLDVETTAQAVAKAAFQNQMYILRA